MFPNSVPTTFAQKQRNLRSYLVVAERGVGIRKQPRFNAKVSNGPLKDETVEVCGRLLVGETRFLRLANGKGWVFEANAQGREMMALRATTSLRESHWTAPGGLCLS